MRCVVVVDGVVTDSRVVADDEEGRKLAASLGWIESERASVGWLWNGGELSPPLPVDIDPDPVPEVVSPAQAKTALFEAGLYDQAEAAVGNSPYALIRIWWASAQEWKRSDPYIHAIAAELGLDDDAVDDLFIAAGQVAR